MITKHEAIAFSYEHGNADDSTIEYIFERLGACKKCIFSYIAEDGQRRCKSNVSSKVTFEYGIPNVSDDFYCSYFSPALTDKYTFKNDAK